MKLAWQNRVGLVLAVCAFGLIAEGAIRMSAQLPVSLLHRMLGAATAALAVVLAAGLWQQRTTLAKSLLTFTLLSGLCGGLSELADLKAYAGVGHALASHLFFALGLVVWQTTQNCENGFDRVEDGGWPSLRSLAWATPVVIVAQIALGAAYRHQIAGVVPHVVGAFIAAVFVLMSGAALFTTQGTSATLRKFAGISLTLLILQILLGVAAYFARVSGHSQLVALTTAHVLTGALLLAVNCVLSSQIWKEVVTVRQSTPAGQLAGSGRNG